MNGFRDEESEAGLGRGHGLGRPNGHGYAI